MAIELEKLMTTEEMQILEVRKMSPEQRQLLADWGMRMFSLSQNTVADIDKVKYDGHLILLDDGSRWEVDSTDTYTTQMWSSSDKVVVVDNEMFRLDDLEKVAVEEE